MRVAYPVPPEPPGGRKNASSSGPQALVQGRTEFDELVQHIEHVERLGNDRDEAIEKAKKGKKVLKTADRRLDKALANLGVQDVESTDSTNLQSSPAPPVRSVVGKSPALSVNTVVGLALGVVTLLGLTLNSQQNAAVISIVTALFVIVPVLAGFIIKAINTRRAAE